MTRQNVLLVVSNCFMGLKCIEELLFKDREYTELYQHFISTSFKSRLYKIFIIDFMIGTQIRTSLTSFYFYF